MYMDNNYNLMYEFVNSYKSMISTLEEYNMIYKIHNEYIIIKYDSNVIKDYNKEQLEYYNNFLRYFRGLIYNKNTNKIVCYGLDGKLNYDTFVNKYNYDDITIEESIDGTMINMYYDNNKWNISTKTCSNADKSYWYSKYSFYELFLECWNNYYDNFDILNKEYCYTFILMHPNNQIVTYYKNPELRLLQIRNMNDFSLIDNHLEIEKPKQLDLICNDYKSLKEMCNNLSYELEGFMLYCNNDRVKIKNKKYLNVKNLKGNYRNIMYRIIDLYINNPNELEELLKYFQFYKNHLDKYIYIKKRFVGSLIFLYNKTKKQNIYIDYPNHISKYVYILHNQYIDNIKNNNKKSIKKQDCIDLFNKCNIYEQINIIKNHDKYIRNN